ncbi:hypothetical protein GGI03_001856 [Coemansia sp. RSA 2337]|nr:hypothetical protein H4S03_002266 [Coemansia sp. S3946]KAJ2113510.1 hypothetical protein IW146_003814 [Coemansia sp. RSA 922]KAJ2466907.1 hypothetical protein GGI03_001856 [Coemansia sp. RSA 2337]
MSLPPLFSDSADEQAVSEIAAEVRQLRDHSDMGNALTSTYIPAFITEYLDDSASILRMLRAYQGDFIATTASLARTLTWREENKVYPLKRLVDSQDLVVDSRGMVLVRARQATMLPRRRASATASPVDMMAESAGWRLFARGVDALEDARVALKAAHQAHCLVAQAAVVVPVESLALADIGLADIARIVDIAKTYYPVTVGRVYVTAASSVLLEHARQALRPMLLALMGPDCDSQDLVVFERADSLAARHTVKLADNVAQLHSCASAALSAKSSLATRALSDYIGRSGSCAESEADADDFCSAYSDARETTYSAVTSCGLGYSTPKRAGSRLGFISRNSSMLSFGRGASQQPLAMSPVSSTVVDEPAVDHDTRSVITPIQLASLQRAVQGVQRMLGSISDSIASADSRLALATSKSRLVQQADVLMSTVAALNFGVSMTTTTSRQGNNGDLPLPRRAAIFISSKAAQASGSGELETPGNMFRRLALHLLALPLSQLVGGRHGSMLGMLRQLTSKTVRLVVRRLGQLPSMQLLMLLAYKHLRIYAMVFWTGALIAWQANAAIIKSSLTTQLRRGIGF